MIDDELVANPTVDMRIRHDSQVTHCRFLVDSGATVTSLPIGYADILGITVDKRKKVQVQGIGNQVVTGYRSEIDVAFGEKFEHIRCFFVENEFVPLLGRLDVWRRYSVHFDNLRGQVVFNRMQ